MCSSPVTFGGGMTIEKTGAFGLAFASGVKYWRLSQIGYHRRSTSFGSYAFGISISINVEKILGVAERGGFGEKPASDHLGDFGRDPPGDLATQPFRQLGRQLG